MRARSLVLGSVLVVGALLLSGCAAGAGSGVGSDAGSDADGDVGHGYTNLPTSGIPDYQLGGAYRPADDVTIVERDSTAHPASGRYSICYVNGFQTQPEDAAMWNERYPDAILRNDDGKPVSDPGWPDEMLLDTSSASARASIVHVLTRSIARCGDRGFDAVEFDNLDSWTRSHGALTRAGNLALAKSLVDVAHEHGLAAGQKNTPQLGSAGKRDTGFDFVVAEECMTYDECGAYTKAYGQRVIDIEYSDDTDGPWSDVCASDSRPAMTILRDRDLVARGSEAYVFEHC
ncbi:glycosyl hydrolase family 114 [Curtobacterium sp. PhB130]|uniref:endo alpha-1,4 polygalactosaminidase n=1 Tax=Curtobacterium sp. PhB130 TaxID=2485178 RepID=UPI000F4C3600|nr:endo alpha-1,4 polygalactosaminidase [Curtobacterium sp. PhB130]ROS77586.1 glycosyl hydrolase family 114 [Curtobacterium sp. PhB130]